MSNRASNLPADIIYECLTWAALEDPPRPKRHDEVEGLPLAFELGWIALTHVCRHWRMVGTRAASLWASIVTVFHNASIADTLLSRAGDLEIEVEIIGGWDVRSALAQNALSAFQWAVAHLHRAHTVHCSLSHDIDHDHPQLVLPVLWGRTLPSLRTIIIGSQDPSRTQPLEVLSLDAPGLLSAEMTNTLPLPSSVVYSLRTLSLYVGPGVMSLTLIRLTTLLRSTPELETLRLKFFHPHRRLNHAVWYAGSSSGIEDVHLDCLKSLSITCAESTQGLDLWTHILAPCATTVIIDCTDQRPTSPDRLLGTAFERQLSYFPYEVMAIRRYCIEFTTYDPTASRSTFIVGFQMPGVTSYIQLLTTMAEHTSLGRLSALTHIRTLHLGPPYQGNRRNDLISNLLGEGRLDEAVDVGLGDAVLNLGRVFVDTTTLVLSGGEEELALLCYVARQQPPAFLPALKTLRFHVGVGVLAIFGGMEGGPQSWWRVMEDFLIRRADAAIPMHRIEVRGQGELCKRGAWAQLWDSEATECCTRGLVQEVADEQVWVTVCGACAHLS
ncbi:hypothetical protein PENSPDRAFT_694920 [Peniophora sp. CONT]|nr:hypothetical protein PENSPDRAFT_694920 [Peniophora sp. CONT]